MQCGYCINGMIMQAAALLKKRSPTVAGGNQGGASEQPLPLRHPSAHCAGRKAGVGGLTCR